MRASLRPASVRYRPEMLPLLVAGLLAGAPLAGTAQELPRQLTVEDALRIARAQSPQHLQVVNDVDAAEAEARQSWGAFLPSLDASLGFSGGESSVITGEDQFGRPTETEQRQTFINSGSSQGIHLSYTLFDGFGRLGRLRAARAATRLTEARATGDAVRLTAEISRLYYEGVRAHRLIQLEEDLLAAAEERLRMTEEMLRVVAASPVDVLGARVDVARQQLALDRSRGEARKALLALTAAMGVSPRSDLLLVSEPPPVFDPAALNADALVIAATRSHPSVREQEATVAAAEHRVDAAQGLRWPRISASAGVRRSVGASGYGALFDLNPPDRAFSFGLTASIPLFQRFETSAQITQARVVAEDARHSLRASTLDLEREVRSALIDLENAYRTLQLADEAAELSRERLEMAQEQYRAGAIRFTELQNVITETARAERDALGARFQFATALVTVEEVVGSEVRP